MEDFSSLFIGKGGARSTDPRTSKEAAKKFASGRATAKTRILAAYDEFGPMSDEQAGTCAEGNGAHKRVSELIREGYVTQVGEERGPHGTDVRICGLTTIGEALCDQIDVCNISKLTKTAVTHEQRLAEAKQLLVEFAETFGSLLHEMKNENTLRKVEGISLLDWCGREQERILQCEKLVDRCLGEFNVD